MPHADIVTRAYNSRCLALSARHGRNGAQVPSAAVPVPASVPGEDLAGGPPDELPAGLPELPAGLPELPAGLTELPAGLTDGLPAGLANRPGRRQPPPRHLADLD